MTASAFQFVTTVVTAPVTITIRSRMSYVASIRRVSVVHCSHSQVSLQRFNASGQTLASEAKALLYICPLADCPLADTEVEVRSATS